MLLATCDQWPSRWTVQNKTFSSPQKVLSDSTAVEDNFWHWYQWCLLAFGMFGYRIQYVALYYEILHSFPVHELLGITRQTHINIYVYLNSTPCLFVLLLFVVSFTHGQLRSEKNKNFINKQFISFKLLADLYHVMKSHLRLLCFLLDMNRPLPSVSSHWSLVALLIIRLAVTVLCLWPINPYFTQWPQSAEVVICQRDALKCSKWKVKVFWINMKKKENHTLRSLRSMVRTNLPVKL